MAEEQKLGYGFASDDVKPFNLHFGLNSNTYLVSFDFTPNAGKDNSEGEALDLKFNIGGTERGLRLFPVDKVFDKKSKKEITDKSSNEYIKGYNEEVKAFGAMVTHVLHCYSDDIEGIKAALSRPFANFKQYVLAAKSLLPSNASKVELDIFLQYQWTVSTGKDKTYLEIPRGMKHGRWLCKHVAGNWKEERFEEANSGEPEKALRYVDENGEKHPFTKSAWFMSNKFSRRTNADGEATEPTAPGAPEDGDEEGAKAMNQGTVGEPVVAETPGEEPESSAW